MSQPPYDEQDPFGTGTPGRPPPGWEPPPPQPNRFAGGWVAAGVALTGMAALLAGWLAVSSESIPVALLGFLPIPVGAVLLFLASRTARSIGLGLLVGWAALPLVAFVSCVALVGVGSRLG